MSHPPTTVKRKHLPRGLSVSPPPPQLQSTATPVPTCLFHVAHMGSSRHTSPARCPGRRNFRRSFRRSRCHLRRRSCRTGRPAACAPATRYVGARAPWPPKQTHAPAHRREQEELSSRTKYWDIHTYMHRFFVFVCCVHRRRAHIPFFAAKSNLVCTPSWVQIWGVWVTLGVSFSNDYYSAGTNKSGQLRCTVVVACLGTWRVRISGIGLQRVLFPIYAHRASRKREKGYTGWMIRSASHRNVGFCFAVYTSYRGSGLLGVAGAAL